MSASTRIASLLVVLLATGCAGQQDGRGPEPAVEDELEAVADDVFSRAWIRPGVDLFSYEQIAFRAGGIVYGEVNRTRIRSESMRRANRMMDISEADRAEFEAIFAEEFSKRFRAVRGFRLTADAGEDVLVVRTGLINVQFAATGDPVTRVETIDYEWLGAATLVVELLDGGNYELVARFVDSQGIQQPPVSGSVPVTRSNMILASWRRLARSWAETVVERLELFAPPSVDRVIDPS